MSYWEPEQEKPCCAYMPKRVEFEMSLPFFWVATTKTLLPEEL